jgi:hypothetical protein
VLYIGRLVALLSDRINMGSSFRVAVEDSQQETLDTLKNDYPSLISHVVKYLAGGVGGSAGGGPSLVPGPTVASPVLQRDTLEMIHGLDGAEDPSCDKRAVVKTEILKRPARSDDHAKERWTLDRCGTMVPYLITFTPSPQGSTDFYIERER